MKKSDSGPATKQSTRLRELTEQLLQLEAKLRRGGGPDKIDRQHQQGKLTARERKNRPKIRSRIEPDLESRISAVNTLCSLTVVMRELVDTKPGCATER